MPGVRARELTQAYGLGVAPVSAVRYVEDVGCPEGDGIVPLVVVLQHAARGILEIVELPPSHRQEEQDHEDGTQGDRHRDKPDQSVHAASLPGTPTSGPGDVPSPATGPGPWGPPTPDRPAG